MTAQLGGISTLIVDDDPDNLEILAFIISAEGATVRTARDGREALDILPDWKPDGCYSHRDARGYELLGAIRSRADLHKVPAIAVTALGYASDKDRALAAGCQAHMTKPFQATTLIELVAWLAARPRSRELAARTRGSRGLTCASAA